MVAWNDSWKLPAMATTRFGPANRRWCSECSSSGSKERTVSGVAQDGPAARVAAVEPCGEGVVQAVLGSVQGLLDLLDDHLLLQGRQLRIEGRVQQHVRQQLDRRREVLGQDLDREGHQVLGGEGVDGGAEAVEAGGDLEGAAAWSSP